MPSVEYGTQSIVFEVLRKARMKHTYIEVTSDGVWVKTNKTTSMKEINNFVSKKSAWIMKHLERLKAKKTEVTLVTGSRLYYLGKNYYVQIIKDDTIKEINVAFTHSKFHIQTPLRYSDTEIHHAIEGFYKQKAIEKIMPLTQKWAKIMAVEPRHISFRYAKKRWGSCSSTQRISFNYHLIKLSSSLIEYVVIHELAHILQPNHSKDFWAVVYHHLPDYKSREEKIRAFEKII